ncbi:MAG: ATP-dependent DNA helicase RecG [Spirochaetaceae bacterium]|nr:ATP-dependent DNA helicase RecG [Spirochaetaceae bacterium]
MKLREISVPVTSLHGVGESTAKLFSHLNIFTVGDLLSYWPRSFDDRTKFVPLKDFQHGKVNTVAKVVTHEWFGYGNMRTLKVIIEDSTARAELVCFNRPFLEKSLAVGFSVRVNGTFSLRYGNIQSSAFEAEQVPSDTADELAADFAQTHSTQKYSEYFSSKKILAVYPLTAGLSQTAVRKAVARAIKEYAKGIADEIPEEITAKHKLMHKAECITAMHMPKSMQEAERARITLIFEELYQFQIQIGLRSLAHRGKLPDDSIFASSSSILEEASLSRENTNGAPDSDSAKAIIDACFLDGLSPRQKKVLEALQFELTIDQKKVIAEMNADIDRSYDLKKPYAMARLLQGDVGSGKTLVAFFACLRVIDYGGQCAMLAPTELLARQHAENAAKILQNAGVSLAFLTGNIKAAGRNLLLTELKNGNIQLVIGTHALFSHNVQYKDLRLAVIDEQHRFGVLQRNAILEKGRRITDSAEMQYITPNLLMMSATPIPQTLALSVFGDLDISVIKSMPSGRLPVKTHLTKQGSEENVYRYVRAELQQGRQAYFVYPLIEQGDTDEDRGNSLKSAEQMYEFLSQKIFPEYKIALIHSKIEENEQREIMSQFNANKIQILVATSVVEVGVDVPNATCMVIEHAERFGLAALHQLRGRVGRSSLQSHCFLIYSEKLTEDGKARLKALFESNDGFFIAEEDLRLRGPGEVLGVQQSGYLTLSIADPVRDASIMNVARTEAFEYIRRTHPGA